MEKSFGEFLKQKRQEKKLTQKELAKMLIVSESAVSKWEKDVAHPDISMLPKLSEILGVTEHELITASVDNKLREEKLQAKKWRLLSFSWSMFFYIAYGITLITCFICDMAINKTLTWFWIVLSAITLAFTFTNLPKFIKKYKLILIPLSMYLALCLLLGVCCIYTKGNWFFIPTVSVFLGLIIIFMPVYISKYKCFEKVRKYNDFISIAVDFIVLNILLTVIYFFTITNGYAANNWYLKLGLPIVLCIYIMLNILLCVRFLRINKLLKTSIILGAIDCLYILPILIKSNNPEIQSEIDCMNIFKADFSRWIVDVTLEQNIHLIIFLSVLFLALVFSIFGFFRYFKIKKN